MKVESSKLSDAISLCNKIVDSPDVVIDCNGKSITVSKGSNFNKVSVKIKSPCDQCNFSIDNGLLLGVLRGTSEIDLSYSDKDKTLKFSSKGKKGVLSTSIYKSVNVIPKELSDKKNFDPEMKKLLTKLLPTVAISPTPFLPESEQALDIQIDCSGKVLKLLCADRYHSAYCEKQVKSDKFSMNIPVNYISYLNLFEDAFEIAKDDNCLYLYNDSIKICLPQVVTSNLINIEAYGDFVANNLNKPDVHLEKFNLNSFSDAMDSTDTVKTATTDIYISVDKKGVGLKCESELGKVYADVDYKGKVKSEYSAIVGQANTLDILSLISKECTFSLFSNFMVFEQTKDSCDYIFLSSVGHKTN